MQNHQEMMTGDIQIEVDSGACLCILNGSCSCISQQDWWNCLLLAATKKH